MPFDQEPVLHNWYRHLDKGQKFEVISFDEDDGMVEVQHFDGDVEALDLDAWYEMDIEVIEAPENWTGPMDDIESDDLGYTETDMQPEDWNDPLREIPPERGETARTQWDEESPEEERPGEEES